MDSLAFDEKKIVRSALQSIALFLIIVSSMMATVKPAHAADPPTVAPTSGQLTYYGTGSGFLCYHPGISPVGSDEDAIALAAAGVYGHSIIGFAKVHSGIYDGKRYSVYKDDPHAYPYHTTLAVTQYVCPEGSNNASPPAYNCGGMPNARNNPNECCPCGYAYDSGKDLCVLKTPKPADCPDQYTLSLKIVPGQVEPSGSADIIATVKDGQGQPKSGAQVSIKVDVEANSGGHDHHDATRPKGSLSGGGSTGADGTVSFTFGAPEVSGTHTFTAQCDSPACTNNPVTAKIEVKVDGLAALSASQLYTFIGANDQHSDNHYLTPTATQNLMKIIEEYNATYPTSRLHLNDASLKWGGKFDIAGNWAGDHAEHRRGVVIDIRANGEIGSIPLIIFPAFEQIAKDKAGASAELHSSGTNRHFHVRLLGNQFRF